MLKTIKVKKQFDLPTLISYVWNNELYPIVASSSQGRYELKFLTGGELVLTSNNTIAFGNIISQSSTLWDVELEEEIDQDTSLADITEIFYDKKDKEIDTQYFPRTSIKTILSSNKYGREGDTERFETLAIYYGKELIWEGDSDE